MGFTGPLGLERRNRAVLDVLTRRWQRAGDIATKLKTDDASIRHSLRKLVETGAIEREQMPGGRKVYRYRRAAG